MIRERPAHFSAQQRRFLEAFTTTKRNIYLRATAGAGKTTTLIAAAHTTTQRGLYLAYNRHAAQDVQARLPDQLRARTVHAQGLMTLRRLSGNLVPDPLKGRHVAELALGRYTAARYYIAARAWDAARERYILTPTDAQAEELAAIAEWTDRPAALKELIPRMHQIGQQLWDAQQQLDYTDMLWLPVINKYAYASVQLALVDEAQDLTPLRQLFILHLLGISIGSAQAESGRLVFVGDPDQSIYQYAGADPLALNTLKQAVNAVELPLSVSFRCPASVVQYAQAHSTFIQSAPQAEAGIIEHLSADALTFEQGDVVLCRTNAPLIRLALDLMAQHISVNVIGRDLETRLAEGLTACLPAQTRYLNDEVSERVRAYYEPLAEPLKQRMREGDLSAKRALSELQDVCRCLRYLAWVVSRAEGSAQLIDALAQLRDLCREDPQATVTLCTVHRSKGKEWASVTILYPELMPLATGDPEEERSVQFVALTRSQHKLRFAYGKDQWAKGWRVQPAVGVQRLPVTDEPEQKEVKEQRGPEQKNVVEPTPVAVAQSSVKIPENKTLKNTPEKTPSKKKPAKNRKSPIPPEALAADELMDQRRMPLLGGPEWVPHPTLRARLELLAQEERRGIVEWATQGLTLLKRLPVGLVAVYEEHLSTYERAVRVARVAVPNFSEVGAGMVWVCVYDGAIARIKVGTSKRSGELLKVKLNGKTLTFDGTGELVGADSPLSPFLMPGKNSWQ